MRGFIPEARACRTFFVFCAPAGEYVKQIKVSNIAHLFSMRTNGLPVKPSGRQLSCRVNHSRRAPRGNFLQPCPAAGKPFSRLFGVLNGQSRNQAVTSPAGSCAFVSGKAIMSLINQSALAD